MDVFHQANNEAKKRQQLTKSKGTESLASSFVCCSRQAGCPWGLVFSLPHYNADSASSCSRIKLVGAELR